MVLVPFVEFTNFSCAMLSHGLAQRELSVASPVQDLIVILCNSEEAALLDVLITSASRFETVNESFFPGWSG